MSNDNAQETDDPTCPYCGCGTVTVLEQPTPGSWFDSGKAVCDNCRRPFGFRELQSSREPE
jgi:hypothetical protein